MAANVYHSLSHYTQHPYYATQRPGRPKTPEKRKRESSSSNSLSSGSDDTIPATNPLHTPIKTKAKPEQTSSNSPASPPRRTLEDYLHKSRFDDSTPDSVPAPNTPATHLADRLRELEKRFIKKNPAPKNAKCHVLDRAAVLEVFNQALDVLETPDVSKDTCEKIYEEVMQKIGIVLDMYEAQPDDPAFLRPGAHLPPLEPKYAQPRLYGNDSRDAYGRRAQWRLDEWRAEGWPDVFPVKAVTREKKHAWMPRYHALSENMMLLGHMDNEYIKDRRRSIEDTGYDGQDEEGFL